MEEKISQKCIVLYKNFPAIVTQIDGGLEKFEIEWITSDKSGKSLKQNQKVRKKDFFLLSKTPVTNLTAVLDFERSIQNDKNLKAEIFSQIQEANELLLSDFCENPETLESSKDVPSVDFFSLWNLIRPKFFADECFGIYSALCESDFFEKVSDPQNLLFKPRTNFEIQEFAKKKNEKQNEQNLRKEFLARLLQKKILIPEDLKFMADVEALALLKSEKSRALNEAKIQETPERAHEILLATGVWDEFKNPYPERFGLTTRGAKIPLLPPDENEERVELSQTAYAIDNAWSCDPDDAISFDGKYLWVHIADPACRLNPEVEKAACEKGATLYIPEGAVRMIAEESFLDYALGLKEKSFALSFRILLDENCAVLECQVFKTIVNVKRLTYEQADSMCNSEELKTLFEIAKKNFSRRMSQGAVQISMPEVHIEVDKIKKSVKIFQVPQTLSQEVVREAMLLAGEGAAHFAFENSIPFPFVTQEASGIPKEIPSGLAGEFKKRKFMRKRIVSTKPSTHFGLGLGMYSQVTSPLRRYIDLLSHMQLRAFLEKRDLIKDDELLLKIAQSDAAIVAGKKAERSSALHWTLVFLLQNADWSGDAFCLDSSMNIFSIPSLALETQISTSQKFELNQKIRVKVKKIDLPKLKAIFEETK